MIGGLPSDFVQRQAPAQSVELDDKLLESSQQGHLYVIAHPSPSCLPLFSFSLSPDNTRKLANCCRLHRDQLVLTERHLGALVDDTNTTLELLESLAESFRTVDSQTSSFQSQCDDLLSEQRRLEKLAAEVRTEFHFYEFLDGVTRRLNAPGASRLVDHESFADMLNNLDACIVFMVQHVSCPWRLIMRETWRWITTARLQRRRILSCTIPVIAYQSASLVGDRIHQSSGEDIIQPVEANHIDKVRSSAACSCIRSIWRTRIRSGWLDCQRAEGCSQLLWPVRKSTPWAVLWILFKYRNQHIRLLFRF